MHRIISTNMTRCFQSSIAAVMVGSALLAGESAAPAKPAGGSLYDLLGGAAWSERRLEITAGLVRMDVDGVRDGQQALFVSGSASAVSGYRSDADRPYGGILGLGTSLKAYWGNDDVHIRVLAPFALGIAGGYTQLNDRTRLELTGRFGPGLARVQLGSDVTYGLAWTWGLEASITMVKASTAGIGIGVGYEAVEFKDVSQDGLYVALRIGF